MGTRSELKFSRFNSRMLFSAFLSAAVLVLSLVLVFNFVRIRQQKHPWNEQIQVPDRWTLDSEGRHERAERLAKSLQFATVSWEQGSVEAEALLGLHNFLKQSFPLIHASDSPVELTVINQYSLLYKICNRKNDANILPYMLAAHLDVVPVGNDSWKMAQPFGGEIVDGVVYGRGALDDKSSVMGVMEAVEFLLGRKYDFKRTFYIAFGHDEEVTGFQGAGRIAEHLKENGVREMDFILDEGYFVLEELVEGVNELVSVIGVTEKGYATLELVVDSEPGHSSIPPKETAIGILARAIAKIEDNPQPSMFGLGPEWDFFSYLSASAQVGHGFLFSNLWLFSPIIKVLLASSPVTDAIQRTTTAVTIVKGGYKSNVVPGRATATVNHRIHPSDSLDQVIEHNKRVIDDPRVQIRVLEYYPPTPVSPYGSDVIPFSLIARSIKQIYPSSVIVPACTPANTDLRRYVDLSKYLYRINPTILTPATREGIHGDDERISVEHYHSFVQFYVRLITNADLGMEERSSTRFLREL